MDASSLSPNSDRTFGHARAPRAAAILGRQLRIPNLFLAFEGDDDLERRLADGLPQPPAVVAVPTQHGRTVVAVHKALESLVGAGKLARTPHLVAASTKMGNAIVWSLAHGETTCRDLDEREVWPSETSKRLAARHAEAGHEAVAAIRSTQGWGFAASDAELEGLAKQIQRTEGLHVTPAAVAGIAALHFAAKVGRLDAKALHVALLTESD